MASVASPARVIAPARAWRRARASRRVCASASALERVVILGGGLQTGRLLAGMFVEKLGGARVLTLAEDPSEYVVPDGVSVEAFATRFGTTAEEFAKMKVAAEAEAGAEALAEADVVVVAHESGGKASRAAAMVRAGVTRATTRVVVLSRVGVNRRDKKPFAEQNKPVRKTVQVGGMFLPIGDELDGGEGALDGYARAESILKEGQSALGYELSVVRSGQLRGNSALALADYSSRLVDNAFDVNFQDVYINRGDTSEGFTKRLNIARFIAHISLRSENAPDDVEVLSVITETGLFGEKMITPKTDRERRKGYDMAKGIAPAAISTDVIDDLLAKI